MAASEILDTVVRSLSEAVGAFSSGFGRVLKKVFGSRNERVIKALRPIVDSINALEPQIKALSDEELRDQTRKFRERLAAGETLDDILPEAFASCRESAIRALGMRHYDTQLMGGIVLHRGMIAEMATGEGKTLVATLAVYLNAVAGKGVYVVTVNDYLAKRDANWMKPVYEGLGLTVGAIQSNMDSATRQQQYACDITYGTNNEFGFDYLRDNMKQSLTQQVQKNLYFAVIDEVDSILIDEARTPLIISGMPEASTRKYYVADEVARKLKRDIDFTVKEKEHQCLLSDEGIEKAQKLVGVDSFYSGANMDWPHHLEQSLKAHNLYQRDKDYIVKPGDDGTPEVVIIDEFTGRQMAGRRWSDGLHQAVEAKERIRIKEESQTLATITFQNYFRLYEKIAGMTGTALTEAAEFARIYGLDVVSVPTNRPNVRKDNEDVVYRTEGEKWPAIVEDIVDCHHRGQPVLVGTASIAKSEVVATYLSDPAKMTEVAARRAQLAQRELEKFKKLDEGTRSELDEMLKRPARADVDRLMELADQITEIDKGSDLAFWTQKFAHAARAAKTIRDGLRFNVLNAKHHEREADIVAQAGRVGAVTVATNMAGRGTDILLGGNAEFLARHEVGFSADEETMNAALTSAQSICEKEKKHVLEEGGLHILGTERHEARRIDNQLRGRAARQGDPGSSRFYLSLEDDLMRVFANDKVKWLLEKVGMTEGIDIQSGMVSRSILRAQKKVENRNFEIRKNLLEYDEVMDKQRKTIYELRQRILEGEDLRSVLTDMIADQVRHFMGLHVGEREQEWELDEFAQRLNHKFGLTLSSSDFSGKEQDKVEAQAMELTQQAYDQREKDLGEAEMRRVERYLLLHVLDGKWKDHLYSMDAMKTAIGLRGYAQVDPKNEYKREGLGMFEALLTAIGDEVTNILFKLRVEKEEAKPAEAAEAPEPVATQAQHEAFGGFEAKQQQREAAMKSAGGSKTVKTIRRTEAKVKRNDPCPCGSGKKFKVCCGR